MNKRFLALAGMAAVLSVGTYVGLNIVKPYKHEEPKVADVTSPDQVFGADVNNPEAHNDAAAPAAAGAAPAPADAAAVQPTDTAVQPASPDQGAGAAPAPSSESAAPAAATASSGGGSTAPLVPAGAPGSAPAATASSTETAAAEPAAAPAAAPAPEPAPAPAAEPAPAPEPAAEPAPAPKPKKTHTASAGKSSKSSGSSGKVWWPAAKDDKLSLVYAGPASFKKAVVLMFNGAFFKPDGIDSNLKVTDKSGKVVSGSWERGENNLRMLVFPVPAAGTYKVSIAAGLTDSKGRKVGKAISGPVTVK